MSLVVFLVPIMALKLSELRIVCVIFVALKKIKLICIVIKIPFIYIITWYPVEVLQKFTLLIYPGKPDEFTLLFVFS